MVIKVHRTRIQSGTIKKISYKNTHSIIHHNNSDDENDDENDHDHENDDENDHENDDENDHENDDENDDENDHENEDENDDENEDDYKRFDKLKYYQFLNKIFPCNYSKDKIQKCKRQRLNYIKKKNSDIDTDIDMDTDNTYKKNINIYFNLKV